MTSMGEEPVSEEEFQAFAKVVILSQNVLGIWRKVKYIQYCQQVLPSNDEGLLDYEGEKIQIGAFFWTPFIFIL